MGYKYAYPLNEEERQPYIKICDFTTAQFIKDNTLVQSDQGTIYFNAPEQFSE